VHTQWLQHTLWQQHGVTTLRLSLSEIPDALELQPLSSPGSTGSTGSDGLQQQQQRLVVRATGQEVGLVYFRAGYTPDDYPSEREWQVRVVEEGSGVRVGSSGHLASSTWAGPSHQT
jgi:glutathione synthase